MLLIENKENSENSAQHMINATIANRSESPETVNTVTTQGVKTADWHGTTTETMSNDDGDGNENGKKAKGLDWQNNNFARALRFFVHFFAVAARLRRESA